jgi:recombination protein RecA
MVGNKTRIKVVKNKTAPPFRTADIDIMYGQGISKEGEILDMGSELDIIKKSGAWYSYNDERIGQGRENSKVFLAENPEIAHEISTAIRKHYGLPVKEDLVAQ